MILTILREGDDFQNLSVPCEDLQQKEKIIVTTHVSSFSIVMAKHQSTNRKKDVDRPVLIRLY